MADELAPELQEKLTNAVAAALGCHSTVQDAEDRIHQDPQFWSARRDDTQNAYRVAVETKYRAGPALGTMTLTCWVHDDESPLFGPNSGVLRVSGLREDPALEHA
eukprot:CAMPEP_0114539158 /NCGR_PEP_ID=MMETSP0114-20121206/90_1 /TAXON_ID=31324 /ORGANISM="Goniomonas sp, Strain m" /LENGTH=104 /DNA_ID=CAMNT_0001723245 /DNA_START=18 /DNA_END=332 /DNA_ORIENTATION=-